METECCSESRIGSETSRGEPELFWKNSAVLYFKKSCSGNILGIGRNKNRGSYFSVAQTESKGETEKGQEWATPHGGAGPPLAAPGCGVGPPGAGPRCVL